jgi:hypothetical protein
VQMGLERVWYRGLALGGYLAAFRASCSALGEARGAEGWADEAGFLRRREEWMRACDEDVIVLSAVLGPASPPVLGGGRRQHYAGAIRTEG